MIVYREFTKGEMLTPKIYREFTLPGKDFNTFPLCLYEIPIFTSSKVSKTSSLAITRLVKQKFPIKFLQGTGLAQCDLGSILDSTPYMQVELFGSLLCSKELSPVFGFFPVTKSQNLMRPAMICSSQNSRRLKKRVFRDIRNELD